MSKQILNKKKCNAIKGKWCKAIEMFADNGDPDARGIAVSAVVCLSPKRKKITGRGHGIRYGLSRDQRKEFGGKYVWLNFCPFCGSDISKRTP